ncbi:MAG: alpha/beta hydrolase fold domain-containing protein [Chloroflexi bacterium]|jgi:acetyl esterase/lipase|nr:alpha/beta hydrolase fold domain-containing protein [Chloroflexota bacterium]
MKKTVKTLSSVAAFLVAGLSALRFFRARSAAGATLVGPKLLAGALSPLLSLAGTISAIVGALVNAPGSIVAGMFGALVSADYVRQTLAPHREFERAFGADWESRLAPSVAKRRPQQRWRTRQRWHPILPKAPEPRWTRDRPFWTVPETDRPLLCDIWQPPEEIAPSGLAFIYFHGSGWHFLDKDVGTRPMFRHLSAQGHVIMDVAYRLCPEAEWRGMLGDVKRAVAWMKINAADYGVDPARIVLGGGSAGGHLALLAAYTADDAALTPVDVMGMDLAVRGVVSWYGPTDMRVYYEHAGPIFSQMVAEGDARTEETLEDKIFQAMGFNMPQPAHWPAGMTIQEAMMRALFGGTPEERPDAYRQASPVTHVDADCPPTLLLQGEHDSIVSAEAVRTLAERLRAVDVPVVHVEYPQAAHAFDLVLPQISPSAQAALYEADRFLAVLT